MDLAKYRFRFKQFGGLKLVKAFVKVGAFPILLSEVAKVTFKGRPLKECYPAIRRKIDPLLEKQYEPLLNELIEKYKDIIISDEPCKIVWFCWMQGLENAPELVKACFKSQQKYIRNKEFIVISNENYRQYIEFPQYIEDKVRKGIIPYSHFTDLIRLQLLIKYGGTWIDSTVLCTSGDYPDRVLDCDLFLFQYRNNKQFAGISNWFITSRKSNKILMILRDMLYQYWKDYDCLMEYYVFHILFSMIAKHFPDEIQAMPVGNSLPTLQLAQQMDKNYNEFWMNDLLKSCNFHKLNYRVTELARQNHNSYYNFIIKKYK